MRTGTGLSNWVLMAVLAAPLPALAQERTFDSVTPARGPITVPTIGLAEDLPHALLERMWCSQVFSAESYEAFAWGEVAWGEALETAAGRLAVEGFALRDQAGIDVEVTRGVEHILNQEIEALGYPDRDAYFAAFEECELAFPL